MDNVCALDEHDSESKHNKQAENNVKKEFVTNWLNSTADEDTDSILSYSTAISSSLDDADDLDMDSLKISDTDTENMCSTSSNNNPMALSQNELLQNIFKKDGNIQTVGNINIENSSQVHFGNVMYITGPIHISSPNDPLMKILFNDNTKTVHTLSASRKPKVSKVKKEEELRIIDKKTWMPYEHIKGSVEYVIISHSATECGSMQVDNIKHLRNIQSFHVQSCRWNDIAYNFMIGCDANVYEGRGWGVVGAHTKGYNSVSVGICFIGCFKRDLPPADSLQACKNIIKSGVESGYIDPKYRLVCQCQCSPTESPGLRLFDEIKTWDHFATDLCIDQRK